MLCDRQTPLFFALCCKMHYAYAFCVEVWKWGGGGGWVVWCAPDSFGKESGNFSLYLCAERMQFGDV